MPEFSGREGGDRPTVSTRCGRDAGGWEVVVGFLLWGIVRTSCLGVMMQTDYPLARFYIPLAGGREGERGGKG
jgi:hypothetical protein